MLIKFGSHLERVPGYIKMDFKLKKIDKSAEVEYRGFLKFISFT